MREVVELCEGQSLVGGAIKRVARNPDLAGWGTEGAADLVFVGGKNSRLPRLPPIVGVPVGVADLFVFEGVVNFTDHQYGVAVRADDVG